MRLRISHLTFLLLPSSSTAHPEAEAEPDASADAQTYTNNAPFSGAIYIVNPNGQQINAASANMCPSYASLSCGNIGAPSWCCPSSYSCAVPQDSNGIIGCCPSGSSCGGSVNVASVTTVTVQGVQQTSYVYVNPQQTVQVYNQPTNANQGGYCATLTMAGPGLPTERQGQCGTILIVQVSEAEINWKSLGYGFSAVVFFMQVAVARIFRWI